MSLTENIPLKAFWDALEQRLAVCSADELRAILRAMAQETPPGERPAFLAKLEPVAAAITVQQEIEQEDLLADIEDLVSQIEATQTDADDWEGETEWGGHDDEDSLGPYAEFVEPLAGLFDRAAVAFDTGHLPLARDAYEALSEALTREDDYGRGIRAYDVTGVDLREAGARYLRAVYETEPLASRPQALLAQMLRAPSWLSQPRPTLESLLQISPRPLPDRERFLADWIAFLRTQEGSSADAWLREAVRLAQGTAGLAALARDEGTTRPRAYLDWCTALAQEGKRREVLIAAQAALQTLPAGLPIRAAIADQLCAAAAKLDEPQAVRAGRWEAFLVKPTLPRLLDLWDVAPAGAERTALLRQAIQHLEDCLAHPPSPPTGFASGEDDLEKLVWVGKGTVAHADLLAEDFDAACELAGRAEVLGWSSSDHPQGLVVPFLLALLSGKTPDALSPNLAQLWQGAISTGAGYWPSTAAPADSVPKRLERIYAELFNRVSLDNDEEETLLAWCLEVAQKRVAAIVSGQHRKSYDKAALLTVACAETLRLRGRKGAAGTLLDDVRERFPRHRAFQTELNTALQKMERGLR